jgi:hypothetical protein
MVVGGGASTSTTTFRREVVGEMGMGGIEDCPTLVDYKFRIPQLGQCD